MKRQVAVLVGAGSIGQAIIRRVPAGKHIVLADYSEENAKRAAKTDKELIEVLYRKMYEANSPFFLFSNL